MRKRIFLLLIAFIASFSLFAQKEVRKDIRNGNKLYKQKLYNSAEASYQSALTKNELSPEALYNLGNTYYEEGKWDEALSQYNKYLEVEKNDPLKISGALHNMGNTFLRKNDLEKSQAMYKQALRLNPNDDETRYNLAVVQKMIKDQQDDQDQNKDNKNQDQNKENQDNKDKDKDQNKDENKKDQDNDKKDNKNQDDEKNEGISQDNIEQFLQAIEEKEKATLEKVQQQKAADRKKQNSNNKRQNKDW